MKILQSINNKFDLELNGVGYYENKHKWLSEIEHKTRQYTLDSIDSSDWLRMKLNYSIKDL
jgi:hypothetical protein